MSGVGEAYKLSGMERPGFSSLHVMRGRNSSVKKVTRTNILPALPVKEKEKKHVRFPCLSLPKNRRRRFWIA